MNTLIATHPTYATDEYSVFKTLQGNRGLNREQVRMLTKALTANPELTRYNPIKVNDKMEVIDGQHRLAAHQALAATEGSSALPIYYTVVDGLDVNNARVLNSGQKPWAPDNYADSFAFSGNANYRTYQTFRRLYGLNHQILARYLSPYGGYEMQTFKSGNFKVMNEALSHKLCEQLADVGEYLPAYIWKNRGFALSYLDAALSENYDHKRMMFQMEKYGASLKEVALKNSEMLPALNHVYNRAQVEKKHLI